MAGPAPVGLYEVRIDGQRFGQSPNKGTDYFEVDVVVCKKIDVATGQKQDVTPFRRTSEPMYVTEGTMKDGMFLEQLRALGYQGDDISSLDPDRPNCVPLKGNICTMRCKHEQGRKDPTKTYDSFAVVTSSSKKPRKNVKGRADRLQAIFGDKLKQSATANPATAPTSTETEQAPQQSTQQTEAPAADAGSTAPAPENASSPEPQKCPF